MSDQWMGSIAAQDQYRPLGNDPWTNTMRGTPVAPGQGFEPVQQSPVLYNTKAGPITEADIENTIGIGMGVSGGGLKTDIVKAPGIKAFHSSPHDFDKFDLAKIGTGEGAQVYGHGLYFAENPAVSGQGGQYWKQFHNKFYGPEGTAATYLQAAKFDREKAAQMMRDSLARDEARASTFTQGELSDYRALVGDRMKSIQLLESGKPVGPRTYEVNIKADPAHMLDWDKPLAQMSPEVQRAAGRIVERNIPTEPGWSKTTGEQFHTAVGARVGRKPNIAAALREAGIPGIKYLDQGSRGGVPPQQAFFQLIAAQDELAMAMKSGDKAWIARQQERLAKAEAAVDPPKTSNYVVFDPSIIDIMKKYGIAGAAPAGMGALAAQDAYRGE